MKFTQIYQPLWGSGEEYLMFYRVLSKKGSLTWEQVAKESSRKKSHQIWEADSKMESGVCSREKTSENVRSVKMTSRRKHISVYVTVSMASTSVSLVFTTMLFTRWTLLKKLGVLMKDAQLFWEFSPSLSRLFLFRSNESTSRYKNSTWLSKTPTLKCVQGRTVKELPGWVLKMWWPAMSAESSSVQSACWSTMRDNVTIRSSSSLKTICTIGSAQSVSLWLRRVKDVIIWPAGVVISSVMCAGKTGSLLTMENMTRMVS